MLLTSTNSFIIGVIFPSSINPRRLEIINCVINSKVEPLAIAKKCANSFLEFLPEPSAIF